MAQLDYDMQFKHDPDQGNVSDIKIENEDVKPDCSDLNDYQHPLGLIVCSSDELFDSEIKKQPELCEEQNAKLELEQEEGNTVKKIPQKRLEGVKRKLDICLNVSTSDVEVNEDFDAEADNEDDIEQQKKKRQVPVVVNTSTIPTEGTTPQPASETMDGKKEVEATQNIMADYLDTELLIVEVQKRPSLWDTSTEEYKDKNKKVGSWEDVCHSLIEGYEEKSTADKNNIGKQIQARWKSIRDSYAKDCRKINDKSKSGSRAVQSRRYIFSKQLSFLKKVIKNRTTTNSLSNDHSTREMSEEAPQDLTAGQSVIRPRTSEKRKKTSLEDKMIEFMEGHGQQKNDDDKDFFMSLLPTVKTLKEEDKLHFRMQVMQVLMNFKAGQFRSPFIRQSQTFPNQYPVSLHNPNYEPIQNQMFAYHNTPMKPHTHHNSVPVTSQISQETVQESEESLTTLESIVCSPDIPSPASHNSNATDTSLLSLYDLGAPDDVVDQSGS